MELSGYNSGGAGPNSLIQVSTKEGIPGIPDAVVVFPYEKFIELMWNEPKRQNDVITGYMVRIQHVHAVKTCNIIKNVNNNNNHHQEL